ncbi:tyrosine-type recombinase/integrase [Planktosalinus lacus]|uniref:Transposase n=1 Tax=Planktosalinus lacus TaxID=1526573 RepID=A0A8J2VBN7_9FLAO|nr:site-specific integrase [Planktosalinus lacus]GGD98948.1 transposase [Planktosalinus lacus]
MAYNCTFNLKDPSSKKPTLIYLRASIKSQNKYLKYSTGEKIHPKLWDAESKFPIKQKGKTKEAIEVNSIISQLSRYEEQFQLICRTLELQNKPLTVEVIRKELDIEFKKYSPKKNEFLEAFDLLIAEKKEQGNITEGTINRYTNIQTLLKEFSLKKNYPLQFNSIDQNFYTKFLNYSREHLKHKDNTLGRNIGFIKTFMNWAFNNKFHDNLEFKSFKKPSSATDEIALSMEELETLYNADLTKHPRLERVRDIFIFGCSTGMRYSDYSTIKKENIRNGIIYKNAQKGKDNLGIPLNKYSKAILEKYNYNLPIISPSKFRDYIKLACAKAGFVEDIIKTTFIGKKRIETKKPKYKFISTHTARRTFITLSLEKGMRPDVVMSITGHKSYSSFQKYIKLSTKVREDEMIKAWS